MIVYTICAWHSAVGASAVSSAEEQAPSSGRRPRRTRATISARSRGGARYGPCVALRAFPVIYASDVARVAAFYVRLGFQEQFRLPDEDGSPGYVGLRRDGAELAVTTEDAPRTLAGIEPGVGPRHELFVYVADVDDAVAALRERGVSVLRDPADMFWGERVAWVADPEGNVVSLASAPTGANPPHPDTAEVA
jgi:lactoylglutathione lyase